MSQTRSPSTQRRYGLARVCRVWARPRSTVYLTPARGRAPAKAAAKRGPKPRWSDPELLEKIRAVLAASPFLGEGHRKVWARLRWQKVRTSKARVLRLMREAHLLAPTRAGRAHGPVAHDGTITTATTDQMWGMDATSCVTRQEGTATVFVGVDHCASECIGIHAAKAGTRFEAVEPLRQGLHAHFGGYEAGIARGLVARHDHGSQYVSDYFQGELRFVGITPAPLSCGSRRATEWLSGSFAHSKSSCCGCTPSRLSRSCAWPCWPFGTATIASGSASAMGIRRPPRSGPGAPKAPRSPREAVPGGMSGYGRRADRRSMRQCALRHCLRCGHRAPRGRRIATMGESSSRPSAGPSGGYHQLGVQGIGGGTGILRDRALVTSPGSTGVPYWDVVDLIEFNGEAEPWIRIGYYRKPANRLVWGSQTTITEPVSVWRRLMIHAAREKPWFRKFLEEIMAALQEGDRRNAEVRTVSPGASIAAEPCDAAARRTSRST